MRVSIALIAIILSAALEHLGQTWVSMNGITIPITLITVGALSFQFHELKWLGLAAGLVLDITSINTFGANTLYYFVITCYLDSHFSQDGMQYAKQWWYKPVVLALAAGILPWYLITINGQIGLVSYHTAVISFAQFSITLVSTGVLFALMARFRTTDYKILR